MGRWAPPLLLALLWTEGCAGTRGGYDPERSQWSKGRGWRPTRTAGTQAQNPSDRLKAGSNDAFESEAYRDALQGYLALRSRYSETAAAKDVEVSFKIAECYFHLGPKEYEQAYPYYLEVLRGSPREETLRATLDRIYDLGIAFLEGRAKRYFIGISYRSPRYGVEILTGEHGLVTNYPYHKNSEEALMQIARYYFEGKEYPEAEEVYNRLVRDYPRSSWVETAEYQQALAVFRQVKGNGIDYDQETLRKARSKFNLYLNHNPRGGRVEEARAFLGQIAELEGAHDLKIAKYYLRESQPNAALLYLRSVLFNNPRTDAAREAREIHDYLQKRKGGT